MTTDTAAATAASPLRRLEGGVELAVKVTPRAGRSRAEGVVVDAAGSAWLAVRLAAAPEGGKANAASRELIAGLAGVAPSAVELVTGAASRRKRLRVAGDPTALVARLDPPGGARPTPERRRGRG